MADRTTPTGSDQQVPAHQVSMPRWAELKRAYVARLSKSERAALAAAAEHANDPEE
ncbi:hypothetical protein [Cryobacterium sp. TMT1-19]|uniref:hypothetical protein n=1 Tax=Cryobacterium sp. TMT1-19 TaxID=1259231 RepID=UPI00141AFDD2|nr:hypothetical protein [Cryobacterium sp. TMT1-19]